MGASRTKNSLRNSAVAMSMYLFNLLLQFYSRKILLEYLGSEILGLNTTASNILQFLNLAELGISSAIACTLYKPIQENDKESIKEIIAFQGRIYKRIALFIICGAILVMCFFPWIFKKMELPLWYAYLSFSVLLLSSLLGYFVNFKQVIFSASQQEYKIQVNYKLIVLLKVVAQMIAVWYFRNGYIWWAILEAGFAILAALSLHVATVRNFPILKEKCDKTFQELRSQYRIIETKIKQLFFHKTAGFVLSQVSSIILFAYTSLAAVTYYQNYMLIYLGFISMMSAVFNGVTASIGNLSTTHPDRMVPVFKELFSARFVISIAVCYAFYTLTPQFICLWIGRSYLLSTSTLLLMTVMLYISLTRQTIENYLYSLGLFQDIWSPIIEVILNVTLSIALGYFWGLNGILTGVIVSLVLIAVLWKPYFLFKAGLHVPLKIYVRLYLMQLLLAALSVGICYFLPIKMIESSNWLQFLSEAMIKMSVFMIIIAITFYIGSSDFRKFCIRIKSYVVKRV